MAIACVTAVAAVLRFWHLGAREIWTDEAISISIARLPWHEFRRVITNREANAAFYEILLKVWTAMFGTSESAVRSLSAIAGTLTVPAVFVVGRRWVGECAAVVGAALLTVNAFHVRYSQETRGYALATLLVVLATLLFEQMREQRRGASALYVLTSVLAVYTHMFAVFVIAAHTLGACFSAGIVRRRALVAIGWVCLLSAPLALFAKTKDVGQIDWIERPSLNAVGDAIVKLSGNGGVAIAVAISVALLIGTAMLFTRREQSISTRAILFGWAFLPFSLSLLMSLRKPVFLPRYLIVALPALMLLAASAVTPGRGRRVWMIANSLAIIALLAFSLRATSAFYAAPFDPPPQRWQELVKRLATHAGPQDEIIFYHPYLRMPFEYSRARMKATIAAPALFPQYADAGMMIAPIQFMDARRAVVPARLEHVPTVWLVRSSPPNATSEALQSDLSAKYGPPKSTSYGAGVDLFVYSRAAAP